ncbi:hypothetical protein QZH41_018049, partial [Actinostola sp. cb2023]
MQAKVNIARTSLETGRIRRNQALEAKCPGTEIQVNSLDEIKSANSDGRFWIKLDATDVKGALMESGRKVWNGDVDMSNGLLQKMREEYEQRLLEDATKQDIIVTIQKMVDDLEVDSEFLKVGLEEARKVFQEKFKKHGTSEETLKNLNWEVIEYQTLLEQNQELKPEYEELLSHLGPSANSNMQVLGVCLTNLHPEITKYLRNLFKKKRSPATHVLVTMISDERRNRKPYALPVRYIAYRNIKDQHVRDLNRELKVKMAERGFTCSCQCLFTLTGTVTDGEFCSLRTKGETRPLHLWQLLHDARESVQKMKKPVLLEMLEVTGFNPDGSVQVARPNPDIATEVLLKLHDLRTTHGLSLEDALTNMRSSMVPLGHTPYPFHRYTPESVLDMLRSITSTRVFQSIVKYWQERGVDFSMLQVQYDTTREITTTSSEEQLLADWHEASDGRGLGQLERCRKNYKMLNYILDEWMPWHTSNYDFSTIDVNRPVENICGFSRETVIEITTNIESQEARRRINNEVGYPMHPRAGGTDDLETFFGLVHRYLGNVFLLKDFKQIWPRLVREFKKRMDENLPFYYWTLNERFSNELPSFDECPEYDENE